MNPTLEIRARTAMRAFRVVRSYDNERGKAEIEDQKQELHREEQPTEESSEERSPWKRRGHSSERNPNEEKRETFEE